MNTTTVTKRIRLASLLNEAAELEHVLLCLYLFAAYSMKKHPDEGGVTWPQLEKMRRWEGSLLRIARQEMAHLGIVTNLLTAIGEAPNFRRPDLPLKARYYPMAVPASLEPLDPEVLFRFLLFEMPEKMSEESQRTLVEALASLRESGFRYRYTDYRLSFGGLTFDYSYYLSIGQLYAEIRELFETIEPGELFIGPAWAQVRGQDVVLTTLGRELYPSVEEAYDVHLRDVSDRESALRAIDQIVAEGEGTPDDRGDCHFAVLLQMFSDLAEELAKDPEFRPARPVVPNPVTLYPGDAEAPPGEEVTVITNPATNEVSRLFDLSYGTMMLMLMRSFGESDENAADLRGLQPFIYFPMMTMVIRPLAEILTQLPAYKDPARKETAGPSFQFGRRLSLLPHSHTARRVLGMQIESMAQLAGELRQNSEYGKAIQDRLSLLYENLSRLASNYSRATRPGSRG